MNKIKFGFISLLLGLSCLGAATVAGASAMTLTDSGAGSTVANSTTTADACAGLAQIDASQGCNSKGSSVTSLIRMVITILSYIIGVVAIIMVMLAGFKYLTSSGDSNKISSAKSTLVYALVGLAIAALA